MQLLYITLFALEMKYNWISERKKEENEEKLNRRGHIIGLFCVAVLCYTFCTRTRYTVLDIEEKKKKDENTKISVTK